MQERMREENPLEDGNSSMDRSVHPLLLARRALQKLYASEMNEVVAAYGLTRVDLDVLLFLAGNPKHNTASDVVALRCLTKSHVSAAVEHLVDMGYLKKEHDDQNRRRVHLLLTENASPVVQEGRMAQARFLSALTAGLSAAEKEKLTHLTARMISNALGEQAICGETVEGTASLSAALAAYHPCCEQEAADRMVMLQALTTLPMPLSRESLQAHFSASAWVVNPARDRVLMVYHNLYDSWAWTGGHADGDADLISVAMREACEETGLAQVRPLQQGIFSLETLTVDAHEKRGQFVPSHLHLNVTYLLEADDTLPLHRKVDENKAVRWFTLAESEQVPSEKWMVERVYRKLNRKLMEKIKKGELNH